MKPGQKKEADDFTTVTALIDATEALLLEEGYAAPSTRRIGQRAGVKPPLIHYYFRSIDDLYLAVFRRSSESIMAHYLSVLESSQQLGALWEFSEDPRSRLSSEFLALANHRPALRAELGAFADRVRDIQIEALTRHFEASDIKPDIPPVVASVLLTAVARHIRLEKTLGISRGHEETKAYFARWLGTILNGSGPTGV